MQFRILALALTLAGTVFAHSPMPSGMRGMLTDPPVTVEKQCEDDDDPKCVKRTYTVTLNVNEKFVKLPLSQQTPRVLAIAKWWGEDFAANPDVTISMFAALNKQVIGWADGTEWVWEAGYVAAINRRAIR
jgi:hypothetical protein